MFRKLIYAYILVLLNYSCVHAENLVIKDKQGMDCYVYLPSKIEKNKKYWLVVGVHGAGGKGKNAGGYASWAKRGDVIVIGPSFNSRPQGNVAPYQNGNGPHAEKLIALFKQLKKDYPLHDKMFLTGFSGGSQFTHRFTMLHPEFVCGVAAHSGGSWATRGLGRISKKAKGIPFAISCGEVDTGKAWGAAPLNRLAWYHEFKKEIDNAGFTYLANTFPKVGHRQTDGARKMTAECFQLATGLGGGKNGAKLDLSSEWKNTDSAIITKPMSNETVKKRSRFTEHQKTRLQKIAKSAFLQADKKTISDSKLITFLKKNPAIIWKNLPGSAKLLKQCEAATSRWKSAAESKNKFNGQFLKEFKKFTEGLEIHKETFSEEAVK